MKKTIKLNYLIALSASALLTFICFVSLYFLGQTLWLLGIIFITSCYFCYQLLLINTCIEPKTHEVYTEPISPRQKNTIKLSSNDTEQLSLDTTSTTKKISVILNHINHDAHHTEKIMNELIEQGHSVVSKLNGFSESLTNINNDGYKKNITEHSKKSNNTVVKIDKFLQKKRRNLTKPTTAQY